MEHAVWVTTKKLLPQLTKSKKVFNFIFSQYDILWD